MEYILMLIASLIGGLFYYKSKADSAKADSVVAETKGRDRELAEQQALIEEAIKNIDEGIKKMKEQKLQQEKAEKYKTLAERAKDAKSRYKK